MQRRTKIIATIGPASESEAALAQLMRAGMDVARLGLAHSTLDESLARYHRVRKVAEQEGRRVGTLVDLPGPKVRSTAFGELGIEVAKEATMRLVQGTDPSTPELVQVDYENLLADLRVGDLIRFGDGQVSLEILDVTGDGVQARVALGVG